MKAYFSILLCFSFSILIGQSQSDIGPYTQFFKDQKQAPKDYIFQQFEENDIIIIGERDHRDTTQYALILDLLADPRFIDRVGHVYTEIGVINRTEWANQVIKGEYESQNVFEEELVSLYRELDYNPIWDKYNMVKYLRGIYQINQALTEERKITIGLTDCPFEWEEMTHEKYMAFAKKYLYTFNIRDSVMAQNFIDLYQAQEPINGQRKALLIQSRPHALNLNTTYKGAKTKRVGSFIKEQFPEQTKIIAFNWYNWVPKEWKSKRYGEAHSIELSANGKWDAAYEIAGTPSIGFNIADTPLGETDFDYSYDEAIKYQDLIDGMIFHLPFYEFKCSRGLPGMVDRKFAKELIDRQTIIDGNDSYRQGWSARDEFQDWKDFRVFDCNDLYEEMKQQMRQWIKD